MRENTRQACVFHRLDDIKRHSDGVIETFDAYSLFVKLYTPRGVKQGAEEDEQLEPGPIEYGRRINNPFSRTHATHNTAARETPGEDNQCQRSTDPKKNSYGTRTYQAMLRPQPAVG